LADVEWASVEPAAAPVPLRFGFDVNDQFQPVLEYVGPELVEIIVEAGGAGMPVLAPMAVPTLAAGCSSWRV